MSESLKTLLSIAGSDPTGGAGIQADIRSASLLGLHPLCAITAVTAQNSKGIKDLGVIPSHLLQLQLNAILEDVMPDAIKIGMIGSGENASVIAKFIEEIPAKIPVVIDPVLQATADGRWLCEVAGHSTINASQILPLATVVTPNLSELEILLNNSNIGINNLRDIRELENHGNEILDYCQCKAMVIKGGHNPKGSEIEDILLQKDHISINRHARYACKNLHGTGCTYSSLLACYLALDYDIEEAFMAASDKISEIISRSIDYTLGDSTYGPLNICEYKFCAKYL